MRKLLISILLLMAVLPSCSLLWEKEVRGNGNRASEERLVSPFTEVEVSGSIELRVSGSGPGPVRIEADENLLSYIELKQTGRKLEIRPRHGWDLRPSRKIIVSVSSLEYTRLAVSGACNITGQDKIRSKDILDLQVSGSGDIIADVDAPELKTGISGSGTVSLKGTVRDLKISISGAGNAKCFEIKSEKTKVEISGAGSAEVFASVSLDAHVSGVGEVIYKGGATQVSQQISGAGSVKKAD